MTTANEPDQVRRATVVNGTKLDRLLVLMIRLGAFLCFAGWTWVHFYWEGPYGILLWQESTYEIASRFDISWDEFVGSGANDGLVQKWIARIGWVYLLCSILTLTVSKRSWIQMIALLVGSGLLVVLSYAKYVAAQYQPPMFIEHGGQMLIPVLLVSAIAFGPRHRITVGIAVVALVTTFAGHGSYALGLWPTPAAFYAMTSLCFQVEYETARAILRVAGIVDFLVCIGIFISPFRRSCALYAATWGFLTAMARPMAGMSWSLNYWGADQFLHEAVLRAPHFLIPLYLFFLWRSPQPAKQAAEQSLTPEPGGRPIFNRRHPPLGVSPLCSGTARAVRSRNVKPP